MAEFRLFPVRKLTAADCPFWTRDDSGNPIEVTKVVQDGDKVHLYNVHGVDFCDKFSSVPYLFN